MVESWQPVMRVTVSGVIATAGDQGRAGGVKEREGWREEGGRRIHMAREVFFLPTCLLVKEGRIPDPGFFLSPPGERVVRLDPGIQFPAEGKDSGPPTALLFGCFGDSGNRSLVLQLCGNIRPKPSHVSSWGCR